MRRGYATVDSSFWMRGTGKQLRGDVEAQIIALYLMSSPSSTMTGIYYLPLATLAYETGIPSEGASKALRRLSEVGFVEVDEETDFVFVVNLAKHQVGKTLAPKDNNRTAVVRQLRELEGHPFVESFLNKYRDLYGLSEDFPRAETEAPPQPLRRGSEGPSKPENREQGSEIRKQGSENRSVEPVEAPGLDLALEPTSKPLPSKAADVRKVFEAWQSKLEHPNAKIDAKRRSAIEGRLRDGYTVEQLLEAIDGCAKSDWHRGKNERGIRYDDIELICRNATKVDMFIGIKAGGKRRRTAPSTPEEFAANALTDEEIDRLWDEEERDHAAA